MYISTDQPLALYYMPPMHQEYIDGYTDDEGKDENGK